MIACRQYAAIVFITNNRFETGKKKLNYLVFDDFVHCASQMIQHWSYSSKGLYLYSYDNCEMLQLQFVK